MDFIYHRISLDIHTAKSQATLKVKQGDTSRKLLITLCENGLPYHIANDCYADFSAVKADGNYLFNDCTISGNTIEYTFTAQTSAAVGAMACEITLYGKDGQRITSPRFTIIVEETVYNGEEIVSSPEANALNELIDRAEHAVDNAESFVDGFNFRVNNTFANAVKGKVSGAVVQVDDVSPVEHIVGCRVTSKNLWNMFALKSTDASKFTVNSNGTITVGAKNYACTSSSKLSEVCPSLKVGDVVTFSIDTDGRKHIYLYQAALLVNNGDTITITEKILSSIVIVYGVYDQDGDFDKPHTISSIQFEYGTVASEYSPYIDVSTCEVDRNGERFPVAADGTVNGMTSVSPSMTVYADNINAVVEIEYNRDSNEVLKEVLKFIDQGGTTPAVARIVDIFLSADAWVEKDEYYSQVVSVEGATSRSQVDLTPSVEQLAIFHDKDLAFVTENVGGVVTVYAIGQKPTNDYTMQATVTEVNV